MDTEAAELLDKHSEDNHSELVRELLKAYYTAGCHDTQEAAIEVRKRELERQRQETKAEISEIEAELERLDSVESNSDVKTVEDIAGELHVMPDMATADNPAIQRAANEHGVDAGVLAEAVYEDAAERTYADSIRAD